ncbi:MAG: hypothetical protein AMDU3_IPLC00002G0380 [Thermoplasmatales archaeon I-plasma]|nr:MAG: hypothetical protein AMDU3_IPLC00002G0380 [Thermoplasmatales archaeon I-plasma]
MNHGFIEIQKTTMRLLGLVIKGFVLDKSKKHF